MDFSTGEFAGSIKCNLVFLLQGKSSLNITQLQLLVTLVSVIIALNLVQHDYSSSVPVISVNSDYLLIMIIIYLVVEWKWIFVVKYSWSFHFFSIPFWIKYYFPLSVPLFPPVGLWFTWFRPTATRDSPIFLINNYYNSKKSKKKS